MLINSRHNDTQEPYWSFSQDQLIKNWNSSIDGLRPEEALNRIQSTGKNTLEMHSQSTPLSLLLNQFTSPIVLILILATIISAFVQDWTDAIIILAIVIGSALLSFFQEYGANNAVNALKAKISVKTTVMRGGNEIQIPVEDVVPGDIVKLSAGSLIPADGVMLESNDFFVNQAALTGETFPVEKTPGVLGTEKPLSERNNCVYMGTSVRSGSGTAIIVNTGVKTVFGQISKSLTLRPPETEFERGIRKLGFLLTEVMFVLVIGIFAINVIFHKPVLDSLLFSIALAVGLTPQLLPAIININLAKGAKDMARQGVIVRRLSAIENFGSMDILCTDKTGTLTLGVVSLDHGHDAAGNESDQVKRLGWLNSHFQTGLTNPLDEAILASIHEAENGAEKIDEIPYDFFRKRLSIVVRENGTNKLICKGALEKVLEECSQVNLNGKIEPLNKDHLASVHQQYADWSEQGYRVLGLATREIAGSGCCSKEDEKELTFEGYLLFFDPPKPEVKETILRLKRRGVSLKIITGDNKLVAAHIARTIGLESVVILTGPEMEKLSDEALWHVAEKTDIFAEVDPNEKERIILALKKTRHVVGYMGDGINDASSLHSADVGISVENAVDVAKEAADFVLLQQDLAVLEQGILEGRRTFANTLKYVFMAVSANFGNMFSVAGASLFLPFLPLLPKQILLINFLTDLPEMTIASDNVDNVYIEKPHRWDVNFIRRFMLVFGTLSSVFDFATFGVLLWGLKATQTQFHTGWFIESILSASFVVFAIRTRLSFRKSHPSKPMLIVTILVALVTLLIPLSPLASLLGLTPLPFKYLAILIGVVLVYLFSAEMIKRWFYRSVLNQD